MKAKPKPTSEKSLRPGTRPVHGSTLSLVQIRKLQDDYRLATAKPTREASTGNPFPSPALKREASRIVKKLGLAQASKFFGVDAGSLKRIMRGEPLPKRSLELAERAIFPSPAQRVELERLLKGPQDVGDSTVQIQQNLVRRGWVKFIDTAGVETTNAAEALTAQITKDGKRAERMKNKRPRRVRVSSGTYEGVLPRLIRVPANA